MGRLVLLGCQAESQADAAGIGRDTASAALAIGEGLQVAAKRRWRLQVASTLARVEGWVGGDERLLDSLQAHDLIEPVLPLVRLAFERLDGQGPNTYLAENLGVEERILSAAVAFVDQRRAHPEEDTIAIFDRLLADPGYDEEIVMTLRSAHMDGSLYRIEIDWFFVEGSTLRLPASSATFGSCGTMLPDRATPLAPLGP